MGHFADKMHAIYTTGITLVHDPIIVIFGYRLVQLSKVPVSVILTNAYLEDKTRTKVALRTIK